MHTFSAIPGGESLDSVLGDEACQRLRGLYLRSGDSLRAMLSGEAQTEPVLDYITDLEVRRELLSDFLRFINENAQAQDCVGLDAAMFAIYMIAPLDHIRAQLEQIRGACFGLGTRSPAAQILSRVDLFRRWARRAVRDCMSVQFVDKPGSIVQRRLTFFNYSCSQKRISIKLILAGIKSQDTKPGSCRKSMFSSHRHY